MDACESGELEDGQIQTATLSGKGIASRGFKPTRAGTQEPGTKRTFLHQKDRFIYNDLVRRSGAIVFSSSKGGELSYERSDIESGLFTHYIRKALSTTDADLDKNGVVSTDELKSYVGQKVSDDSNKLQNPTVDRDNIFLRFGFVVK
jgi:hypothetical protein